MVPELLNHMKRNIVIAIVLCSAGAAQTSDLPAYELKEWFLLNWIQSQHINQLLNSMTPQQRALQDKLVSDELKIVQQKDKLSAICEKIGKKLNKSIDNPECESAQR